MAEGSGKGPPGKTRGVPIRARRARIEEIRELAREYGHESSALSPDKPPSPGPLPEGGIFWIAEDAAGDDALGYAAASLRPDGLTIGPVYVRPRERRRGVGQALLQAIQHWAEETGIPVVEVSVAVDDETGRSFLESAGYVPRRILFSHPGGYQERGRDKSHETSGRRGDDRGW